jgi:hypothetical protein
MPSNSESTVLPRRQAVLPVASAAPSRAAIRRREASRRRQQRWRLRQGATGLALSAGGGLLLTGLMAIPQRFDGVLLISKAIADLIAGLHRLAVGLLQLTGVLVVALVAVLALLLLVGGLVRIVRALAGRPVSPAGDATRIPPAATTTRGR